MKTRQKISICRLLNQSREQQRLRRNIYIFLLLFYVIICQRYIVTSQQNAERTVVMDMPVQRVQNMIKMLVFAIQTTVWLLKWQVSFLRQERQGVKGEQLPKMTHGNVALKQSKLQPIHMQNTFHTLHHENSPI